MGIKKVIPNIVLVVCSILFSLAVIEIVLPRLQIQGIERHVFLHKMPIVQYMYGNYHPVLGYTLEPNLKNVHISYKNYTDYTVRSNNDGFRGGDWDRSKDRKNIIILGDSFAFGWGVEEHEMFSTLLEDALQEKDLAYQVVNLAQSGFFLDQIVNTFRLFGEEFEPVLVVYLYCHNDSYQHPQEKNGRFDIASFRSNVSVSEWLYEAKLNNSNIWRVERFWKGLYLYAFYKNYLGPVFFVERETPRRAWKERYLFTYKDLTPPTSPDVPVQIDLVSQRYIWYCLSQIKEQSKDKPLILMDTADKMTLHLPDRQNADRWILRDFARQYENGYFVDYESELRRRNDGVSRFLEVDDHWNPEGHRLAAAMLIPIIFNALNL